MKYSTAPIEEYLRASYTKPKVGLFARILGESPEYSYSLASIEEHRYSSQFKNLSLHWISVQDSYLDHQRLPSSKSWGLFALQNERCIHLKNSKPENFSELLRIEGDLTTLSAAALAAIFCDAVLSGKSKRHIVLHQLTDIQRSFSRRLGYQIDLDQIEKIKDRNIAPTKELFEKQLIISFYVCSGQIGSNQSLSNFCLTINDDKSFNYQEDLITDSLFKVVPFLRYAK